MNENLTFLLKDAYQSTLVIKKSDLLVNYDHYEDWALNVAFYCLYASMKLMVLLFQFSGTTAQSVLCQPIVQSNGDLVGV